MRQRRPDDADRYRSSRPPTCRMCRRLRRRCVDCPVSSPGSGLGSTLVSGSPTATDPAHQLRLRVGVRCGVRPAAWTRWGCRCRRCGRQSQRSRSHEANGWRPWSGSAAVCSGGPTRADSPLGGARPGRWRTHGPWAVLAARRRRQRIERTADQAARLFASQMTVAGGGQFRRGGRLPARKSRRTNRACSKPPAIGGDRKAHSTVLERLPAGRPSSSSSGMRPTPAGIAADRLADRPIQSSTGNMMLRLNDPLAFLRGIHGWVAANRPPDAQACRSASSTPT